MGQVERVAHELEKPIVDDRAYRVIRLPNRLEALLVHDPNTDKASAALNVNVGNFSDDDDMPGMAHAVEHALFMGTEKVCHRSDSRKTNGTETDNSSILERMSTTSTLPLTLVIQTHTQLLRRRITFSRWPPLRMHMPLHKPPHPRRNP